MVHKITKADLPPEALGKRGSHKYDNGHVLVLSGDAGHTGAARLAAEGALRMGAGLVTLVAPPEAGAEIAAQITAVMVHTIASPSDLADILADQRVTTVVAGPGFGLAEHKAEYLANILETRRLTILDADALTLISGQPALFSQLHENCVLTPHLGEFNRLFPDLMDAFDPENQDLDPARGQAVVRAAARAGCCVLLKGPRTFIAGPDQKLIINDATGERLAPWLATAGSGDVLAGFIAGLAAKGLVPLQAASCAAWLHVECARSFGPGLIAEDIAKELPRVFSELLS